MQQAFQSSRAHLHRRWNRRAALAPPQRHASAFLHRWPASSAKPQATSKACITTQSYRACTAFLFLFATKNKMATSHKSTNLRFLTIIITHATPYTHVCGVGPITVH